MTSKSGQDRISFGQGTAPQIPTVDVIIPHYGDGSLVTLAIRAALDQTYQPSRIIVVDDASPNSDLIQLQRSFPGVVFIPRHTNGGFVAAVSDGISRSKAELIALLNNDAVPSTNWLQAAVRHLTNPGNAKVLGVTSVMVDSNGIVDVAGMTISARRGPQANMRGAEAKKMGSCRPVTGMCGGAAVVRRSQFLRLGGMDPSFVAYHEDIDVSLRAALYGWSWLLCTDATVLHRGGASFQHGSDRHLALSVRNEVRVLVRFWPSGMNWSEKLALTAHVARTAGSICVRHRKPSLYLGVMRQLLRERRRLVAERQMLRSLVSDADGILRSAWRSQPCRSPPIDLG